MVLLGWGCVPRERTSADDHEAPGSALGRLSVPAEAAIVPAVAFEDTFDRAELGGDWLATSPRWRLEHGQLCAQGARNHPAWLRRRLAVNARIEFDAISHSPEGDIKVEMWGDGRTAAHKSTYDDATSYLAILGGWQNRWHVLARLDEHGSDRVQLRVAPGADDPGGPVQPHRTYRFRVERTDGHTVRWWVDGIELASFEDPKPLLGIGHEYFAFNDWESPVCFDNLSIIALDRDAG